jgi:choice-of-anchor C domain-containing protein
MNKTSLNILAALAACFGVCNAQANLLINGSFDSGVGAVGALTSLTGWTVKAGNIDLVSTQYFGITAADGEFAVDLTGSFAAGRISQTAATLAGETYTLGFWFGGNPQWQYVGQTSNDSPIKSMDVLVGGVKLANFSVDTTGRSWSDASWVYKAVNFEALSSSTEIEFDSLNSYGVFGPLLDGASLEVASPSPIPEPETYVLMFTGFAAVAAAARRRRAR